MNLEEDMKLPTVGYFAAFLLSIRNCRINNRRARLYTIRSEVERKAALLRETSFRSSADMIIAMLINQ
jgi:hypothetical protein